MIFVKLLDGNRPNSSRSAQVFSFPKDPMARVDSG
jgi:hypothetical protein